MKARDTREREIRIMLDASTSRIRRERESLNFDFWQLRTPLTQYRISDDIPYGLDNGCFSGELPKQWFTLLEEAKEKRPVFVALPDCVGSARRTLDLFHYFKMKTNGLPRALVLQDGIADVEIPWADVSAVFIGGTDAFKISQEAFAAARCAKMLGKWVHVGRVNTAKRMADWIDIADSIDGSGLIRTHRSHITKVLDVIKNGPPKQLELGRYESKRHTD